jgi:hypothetical protein
MTGRLPTSRRSPFKFKFDTANSTMSEPSDNALGVGGLLTQFAGVQLKFSELKVTLHVMFRGMMLAAGMASGSKLLGL